MLRGRSSTARGTRRVTSYSRGSSSKDRGRGVSIPSGAISTNNDTNIFESERQQNAAKRQESSGERGQASKGGSRGSVRGRGQNKSVRFTDTPPSSNGSSVAAGSAAAERMLATSSSTFGTSASNNAAPQTQFNPFAKTKTTTTSFNNSNGLSGSATDTSGTSSPFGGATSGFSSSNPFQSGSSPQSQLINGLNTTATNNPFAGAISAFPSSDPSQSGSDSQTRTINGFDTDAADARDSQHISNPFAVSPNAPTQHPSPFHNILSQSSTMTATPFLGSSTQSTQASPSITSNAATIEVGNSTNGPSQIQQFDPSSTSTSTDPTSLQVTGESQLDSHRFTGVSTGNTGTRRNRLGMEINALLKAKNISAPGWPTKYPGDPGQKAAMEGFWQNMKAYRSKVRAALITSGYLDDPDKPKKLSEAIDFRGTCEEMCPDFERVTRIVEHDVQAAEKDMSPNGESLWPATQKMIKALARSAAGQDAPLPEDVRSGAALRRTLDYLIDMILADNELPTIHGFLWDRTRAIRRDFVFQQSSMNSEELVDQVYCLERISRFHVIALHQMSNETVVAEDFSEQQEVEQLGKALLSLIHAYEDCKLQGIECENEAEFRAYYVLFNSHDPGILEVVQDWGYALWKGSDQIKIALSLVEAMQNNWDALGPLKPQSPSDISLNSFNRFFAIIKDPSVSYTMACFAEIHFNKVRKAALKTIVAAYRKQKDQSKDWTLSLLNTCLRFDNETQIIPFGEAHGLLFDRDNDTTYLALRSDDSLTDPFPKLKQAYSANLVESKRGSQTLPEAIHRTVFATPTATDAPMSPSISNYGFQAQSDKEASTFNSSIITEASNPELSSLQNSQDPSGSSNTRNALFTSAHAAASAKAPTQFSSAAIFKTFGTVKSHFTGLQSGSPSSTSNVATSFASPLPVSDQGYDSIKTSLDMSDKAPVAKPLAPPQWGFPSSMGELQVQQSISPRTPSVFESNALQKESTLPITSPFQPQSASQAMPSFTFSSTTSMSQTPSPLRSSQAISKPASLSADSESSSLLPTPINLSQGETQHYNTGNESTLMQSAPAAQPLNDPAKVAAQRLDDFTNWYVAGKFGILDQYVKHQLQDILSVVFDKFREAESTRLAQEEQLQDEAASKMFRYHSIVYKYGNLWRINAHRLWTKRKGREAREARRQMAEREREIRTPESHNILDDFKASQISTLRKLQDVAEHDWKVPDGRSNHYEHHRTSMTHARQERRRSDEVNLRALPSPSHFINSSLSRSGSFNGHRRNHSEVPLSRSLLSEPRSFSSSTRSMLSAYDIGSEKRGEPSAVKTNYFRLKARGIVTLPGGNSLARSVVADVPDDVSYDSFTRFQTPRRRTEDATPKDQPSATANDAKDARLAIVVDASEVESDDVEAIKARARAIMAAEEESRKLKKRRRSLAVESNDDELFAKARRIREQMNQDVDWFKAEIEKATPSGSRS